MKTTKERILEFQDKLEKWSRAPDGGLDYKGRRQARKWLKKQFNQVARAARAEGEALARHTPKPLQVLVK